MSTETPTSWSPILPPEAAERIFDAFYTTKSDGMGIGLAVSRAIAESHRGRLWAVPNDGPGTTFMFSIPACGGIEPRVADGEMMAMDPVSIAEGAIGISPATSAA